MITWNPSGVFTSVTLVQVNEEKYQDGQDSNWKKYSRKSS